MAYAAKNKKAKATVLLLMTNVATVMKFSIFPAQVCGVTGCTPAKLQGESAVTCRFSVYYPNLTHFGCKYSMKNVKKKTIQTDG